MLKLLIGALVFDGLCHLCSATMRFVEFRQAKTIDARLVTLHPPLVEVLSRVERLVARVDKAEARAAPSTSSARDQGEPRRADCGGGSGPH